MTILVVQDAVQQSFPGQPIGEITQLRGGVSGSALAQVRVGAQMVVAKVGPHGVGTKERDGAKLIAPFLPVPAELGLSHEHWYMRQFVAGPTVDQLVRDQLVGGKGSEIMQRYVSVHADMWLDTLQESTADSGYPTKLKSTSTLLQGCQIGGRPLMDMLDMPISVNGKFLPSIRALLRRIEEVLSQDQQVVLSHGDEGACNAIVTPRGKQFFIDHGTVGHRLICEPVAKSVLWFPVTMAQPGSFSIKFRKRKIEIVYSVVLDMRIRTLVRTLVRDLFAIFRGHLSRESFYAGLTMYLLRELQWLKRRGRELMLLHTLAMALEAGAKLLRAKGGLAFM